jgi:hypothetical protein
MNATEARSLAKFDLDLPAFRHIADLRGEVRQEPPMLVRRDDRQVNTVRRLLGAKGWVGRKQLPRFQHAAVLLELQEGLERQEFDRIGMNRLEKLGEA